MKKNILKATVVAAFALVAGFNVYNSQKSDVMSELALANVEALADDDENPIKNEAKVGIDANDKKEYGGCGNLYRSCGNSERNSFYYPE